MNDGTPGQEELVPVSVPRQHLIAVYGFLADLANEDATEVTVTDPEAEVRWPTDDLAKFAATPTRTSTTIGKVMDVLSDNADQYLSTSELEDATGVTRANLKGAFAALTRHINAHYNGRGWMLTFKWGPSLGPDYPAEAHYMVSAEQAARWKEARAR
jgi:hypothetical protein